MKILILAKFLPKDGATTHMYTLAKGFAKRGHEVHMISAGPTRDKSGIDLYNRSMSSEITHHKLGFPCYYDYTFIGKAKQMLQYIFAVPKGLYILNKIKPDVIHVHYPVTSYLSAIYRRLSGKKFVTTYHIKGITDNIMHKKADRAIAISSELKEEIVNRWEYNGDSVDLVFNGVSREKFDRKLTVKEKNDIKDRLELPKDKIIIGFVGKYETKKGIDILLEACSKIDNNKFRIVLLGDGDNQWVNTLIKKFNVESKVIQKGFQDPTDFYSIFDIFVLPSRNEGFPLVALEAMMMGVPTIRSNTSGAYDMINHKVDGYIFENENINELQRYIEELVNDNNIRKEIGEKGKEKAINNFTEDIMIDKLLKSYKKLIE